MSSRHPGLLAAGANVPAAPNGWRAAPPERAPGIHRDDAVPKADTAAVLAKETRRQRTFARRHVQPVILGLAVAGRTAPSGLNDAGAGSRWLFFEWIFSGSARRPFRQATRSSRWVGLPSLRRASHVANGCHSAGAAAGSGWTVAHVSHATSKAAKSSSVVAAGDSIWPQRIYEEGMPSWPHTTTTV